MSDEERTDAEQPEADAPQADDAPEQQVPEADEQAPSAEPAPEAAQDPIPDAAQAPAEEPVAEEPQAEEPAAAAEEQPAEEPAPAAEEPKAEEPAAEPEPKQPAEPAKSENKKEKKEEVVPGAELDPIALEPDKPLSAEEQARRDAEAEEKARREAELTSEAPDDAPLAAKPTKLSGDARFLATGKRKSSVARVMLTKGSGAIKVNERALEEYFPRSFLQTVAKQPLVQSGYEGNVDVRVRVHGGGISGQASAVRHGIARALVEIDPELRGELKRRGMLTRDARVKERRKAGLKKARKKPQFSKR
jgi:small subunit ribosomal protein S9